MNTETGANSVATNLFPLQLSHQPAIFNCAAFSTSIIGTGFALSLYGIFKGGRPVHKPYNPHIPVHWLEYPAYHVPPVMDLFSEDKVPFGVSSQFSCPSDSEHLERAFDLLRYQHLYGKLGVPSVVDQNTTTLVRPLQVLGNASGYSLEFSSASNVLSGFERSSTQGGHQKIIGGSSGSSGGDQPKEKYADDESSYPKTSGFMAIRSTGLPFVSGEPISYWSSISVASLVLAITVFALLVKRDWSHCQSSSEPCKPLHGQEDYIVFHGDDAPVPSSRLVPDVLTEPEQPIDTRGGFFDNVRSKLGFLVDAFAPVDSAARFVALQDALFQILRNMAERFLLTRFLVLGMAILKCSYFQLVVFLVTGRFGLRGIHQLMLLRDSTSSDPTLTAEIGLGLPLVETPERQEIEPAAGGSEILSTENHSTIDDDHGTQTIDLTEAGDDIEAEAFITPSCSTSTSLPAGQTVETQVLAPVADKEKDEDGNDENQWTVVNRRKRGCRGRRRGGHRSPEV